MKEDNQLKPALHGGDIVSASKQYNIAQSDWIDLSTGLNPDSYPTIDVPSAVFCQLPYLQPAFTDAAERYYGSAAGMALIGSQMIIQALPKCVEQHPVLLPSAGYTEHREHWLKNGFAVSKYNGFDQQLASEQISSSLADNPQQHLVIINPNNPTGLLFEPEDVLNWAQRLGAGCCLVLDEAFIDTQPEQSLLMHQWPDNVLILRSFGKFFGLAGIRIGFAFCKGALRSRIEQVLGLWMINGPAQYIAAKAMDDEAWQQEAIEQIAQGAKLTQRLFAPLIAHVLGDDGALGSWSTHQALFSSYQMPVNDALKVQEFFAQRGILLRVIRLTEHGDDNNALLRIGILKREDKLQHQRIERCIANYIAK